MDAKTKGGLIGFVISFIGLWIIIFFVGHDPSGWKCVTPSNLTYCTIFEFIFNIYHVAFVLLFSWVGFIAGRINARMINNTVDQNRGNPKVIPLKVTSIVMTTAVIVFGILGTVAFDDWIGTMIYALIFFFFVIFVAWAVGKYRYKARRH